MVKGRPEQEIVADLYLNKDKVRNSLSEEELEELTQDAKQSMEDALAMLREER
ncbi:MAG: hypothetical protein M2R45_03716 [Verrucomicrobia subdivision 3 bacterium]|nr:hypothetical protein [Limisphaerales bacterium]MCS1416960.1 hypothetical protein [Limisphaerales bacterium]